MIDHSVSPTSIARRRRVFVPVLAELSVRERNALHAVGVDLCAATHAEIIAGIDRALASNIRGVGEVARMGLIGLRRRLTTPYDIFLGADRRLREAQARYDAALKAHQDSCQHGRVYEVDYNPNAYGQLAAPKRVCATCGWAERGWHCGYGRLDVPSAQVQLHCTEENFERLRRGEIHQWTPSGRDSRS